MTSKRHHRTGVWVVIGARWLLILAAATNVFVGCRSSSPTTTTTQTLSESATVADTGDLTYVDVPEGSILDIDAGASECTVTLTIETGMPGAGTYSCTEHAPNYPLLDAIRGARAAREANRGKQGTVKFSIGVVGREIRAVRWAATTKV